MARVRPLLLLLIGAAACQPAQPAAVRVLTSEIDPTTQPYFSQPWPDDRRLNSDGTIPTDNFPNPGGMNALFSNDLEYGNHLVYGWGTASPIYMPFTGEIDPNSLPADVSDTNGSVFLVVIDPASPLRGHRAYVDFHYYLDETLFLPGNILAIRPVPGFPLEPKTQYALVVTTGVKDNAGYPVGASDSFNDILQGKPKGSQEESDAKFFQPLLNELNREKFPLSKVAGATVFTTQAITDELTVLANYLLAQPVPGVDGLHLVQNSACYNCWLFEGTYQAPHMQHGTLPYVLTGGGFEYTANGTPIPDFSETMRLAITVPKDSVMGAPANDMYPAFMYSHGTGGDFESIVDEENPMGPLLASKGLVGFGIDQVLTGPRAGPDPGTCLGEPIEDCFFDYVNPVAGRNNLRQAALDNVFLRQVATHLTIPAAINPDGHDVVIDNDRIGFLGHSQGGITGALYSAIDSFPWGSVLSGAGGLLTATVLERQDPDAKALAEGPLFLDIAQDGELLDWYHPALALVQAMAEVVDPLNYAQYWIRNPLQRAKNMYITGGLYDEDTMPDTAEYMVAAAGIPQMIPIGQVSPALVLAGLVPVLPPLTDNLVPGGGGTAVTAGFRQYPGEGHFPIFDDPVARDQLSTFLQTALANGTATIPAE